MDHKSFKQDLTYCCKKFPKDGKVLSSQDGNLDIAEGKFVANGNYLDALEMFVLMKGYVPTAEMLRTYHEHWEDKEGVMHRLNYSHHEAYNINIIDVVVEQAQIAKEDIYAFLDGFDNVIFDGKNEFYNVGVYIREKFQPAGCRTEPLGKQFYEIKSLQGRPPMKKFVIHTMRGKTSIVEVECYLITRSDDPTISFLPEGEYYVRIAAPAMLFEKKPDGSFVPPMYHSFALYDTLELAKARAEQDLFAGFERNLRKRGIAFTEADVQLALSAFNVIML